ncbi:M28 family peptidase [Melioribacteraceae bacterium 4301-Me]|uniref:M28 family peptidase n=1 Tax=Pyranulibacter aquaticus TaxID=3163344 RepID=UPI00359B1817
MKKLFIAFLLIYTTSSAIAQKNWYNPQITPKDIKAHIFYIASDEFKGRFTGSKEIKIVGNYIKKQFESYGLKPLFNNSYFQEFPFIEKLTLTKNNTFSITGYKSLKLHENYITAPFSGKAELTAELVFAGYGISAPKLNYDDYDGIDVKGKVVIVMRYNPEHDSSTSQFDSYSSFRKKAANAKDKGAAGIIFVNGFFPKDDKDELMQLRYDGAPGMKDFAVLNVKRNIIDELFKKNGVDLSELQTKIDKEKKPASFYIDKKFNAIIKTEVREIQNYGRNVAGFLEGNDPKLKKEYIVIGAHYDHLGIDQMKYASMYKGDKPQIHNGADDNASGTCGVLELAEKFSSLKDQLKRSLIFIAFSGEELGILGSTYFVNNPPFSTDKIAAMLNMDMIGRLNEKNELTIIGTGTSTNWKNLLNKYNKYNFELKFSEAGTGGSDHQAFTNKNIPVLFFFTGMHSDYHKPTDDPEKINLNGEANVVNYVYDIAYSIDTVSNRPDFVKVEEPKMRGTGNTKVSVGTIPEFGYNGNGYKISGVTEGGAAQKAGMKGGDIIIKFGNKEVNNIYDFMYAIEKYNPGDSVDVIIIRDGKEIKLKLELQAK